MSLYRTGVAPVYPGIWHPSRFIPVHPGCIKHFKATGDMSRFNTVHPGSPRFSTVPPRFYPGSSRFIPDHRTGVNRGLKPALWERSFTLFRLIYEQGILWTQSHECRAWCVLYTYASKRPTETTLSRFIRQSFARMLLPSRPCPTPSPPPSIIWLWICGIASKYLRSHIRNMK